MAPFPCQHMLLSIFLIWQSGDCIVLSYCGLNFHLPHYKWNWSHFHIFVNGVSHL